MSHIFLSHVEKDLAIMEQIAHGLEAVGYKTWYFERDVFAGTSYLIQITNALESCDAIVLIASPHACSSDQVTKEVVGAFERGKPFFPVLINMTPPELKECQPEWRHALGGTAMIIIGEEGIPGAITRILHGLKAKGILPEGGKAASEGSTLSAPMPSPPKHVIEKVLATRTSMEGERKQVTVLFADVKGYTSLSEKLDPEEVHDLIRSCIDFMTEEIHHYEGTIAQFLGDGIMALFGAPIAHEDAPQRALYTALAIQRHLKDYAEKLRAKGIEFAMRIGINTGLVIVGRIGDDLTMEYTAIGDTVNLASRMESSAEPGTIQVAEDTYRQTEGYFDFQDLGETTVKGREQPVRAYRVLGPRPVRTRIEASLDKGLTPFVGRTLELEQLMACLEKVQDRIGQVVGVVGEPGMGKSRLIREFTQSVAGSWCSCLEGKCLHYGDAIPYLPILDILKSCFDTRDTDDEAAIMSKMSERISELGGHLAPFLTPLHEVLSLPVRDEEYLRLEPRQRREKVFEAIRLLLVSESMKKPLVVVVDDLHWIDKTSEEFLSSLIAGLANTRILLILLYRPEYVPAWTGKTYFSQIRVDQLPKKTSAHLVQSILTGGDASPELIDLIVSRSAGNPLFMEELTHNLLENGSIGKAGSRYELCCKLSDIQVPGTIQGIIAARMDRLEEKLKRIIQTASVIGREFAFRILQAVTSLREDLKSSLLTLQDLEFINEKSLFPELEYIFKHALTQEVAYNSLLLKRRKETHERVGQAIENLYENRLEEFFEMLAYHYSLSNDSRKAYQYLKLSADKAVRNYANWEAIRFYKEALRMLDTRPEDDALKREKVDLLLGFQVPLFKLGYPQDSIEILHRSEVLAQELSDQRALAQFHRSLSLYHTFKGDLSLGVQYAEKCFSEAEQVEEMDLVVQSADQVCFAYFMKGNMLGSADVSRRALELFERYELDKGLTTGGLNVYSLLCSWLGGSLAQLGRFEEARSVLEKGISNAHEFNDWFQIGMGMMNLCDISLFEGNSTDMIAHAREHVQCNEKGEIAISLGLGWSLLGFGYFLQGELEIARDYAEKGLSMQKEFGMNLFAAYCYWFLSFILLGMGDLAPARKNCEETLKLAQEVRARHIEGIAFMVLGVITGKEDRSCFEEARNTIQKGISILEELKLIPSFAIGYVFLGELFADAGRNEEALQSLKKAETLYLEMKVTPQSYWLKRIHETLAKLV